MIVVSDNLFQHHLTARVEEVERFVEHEQLRAVEHRRYYPYLLFVACREVAYEFLLSENLVAHERLKTVYAFLCLLLRHVAYTAYEAEILLRCKEIYEETWEWLKSIGCTAVVSPQLLERYAMCAARWIQCEEMTSALGYLSKHPTTGKPIPSPFISIGINYMNQANRLWNEIYQIVKENCSAEYSGANPQDDLMERLLSARKGS